MRMLPKDTHVLSPREIRRLVGQNARIYARLTEGPATRRELAALAVNVTGRVSDVRAYLKPLGLDIDVDEKPNGLSIYRMVELLKKAPAPVVPAEPLTATPHDLNRMVPGDGRLW
jgi:hypothetical protein